MSRRSHFPRRLIDTTTGWFRVLVMVVAAAIIGICAAVLMTKSVRV